MASLSARGGRSRSLFYPSGPITARHTKGREWLLSGGDAQTVIGIIVQGSMGDINSYPPHAGIIKMRTEFRQELTDAYIIGAYLSPVDKTADQHNTRDKAIAKFKHGVKAKRYTGTMECRVVRESKEGEKKTIPVTIPICVTMKTHSSGEWTARGQTTQICIEHDGSKITMKDSCRELSGEDTGNGIRGIVIRNGERDGCFELTLEGMYQIGESVECRDSNDEKWKKGVVIQTDPLRVQPEGWDKGNSSTSDQRDNEARKKGKPGFEFLQVRRSKVNYRIGSIAASSYNMDEKGKKGIVWSKSGPPTYEPRARADGETLPPLLDAKQPAWALLSYAAKPEAAKACISLRRDLNGLLDETKDGHNGEISAVASLLTPGTKPGGQRKTTQIKNDDDLSDDELWETIGRTSGVSREELKRNAIARLGSRRYLDGAEISTEVAA